MDEWQDQDPLQEVTKRAIHELETCYRSVVTATEQAREILRSSADLYAQVARWQKSVTRLLLSLCGCVAVMAIVMIVRAW